MRILLVEDDEVLATSLEKILNEQHYVVDVACDGQTGWELFEAFTYDLILLDVLLPRLDGIKFCQQLRVKDSQIPVLILTAQNSSTDKVTGLDAGADDYLVKPFELLELLARIRALLRRKSSPEKTILEWLNLRLDPDICRVTYRSHVLHLTPKEYRLLELFLRNHHRVFSRSAILDHLWSCEESPREDTVTAHIKALRQKLKEVDAPTDLIETVYGQGYRLKQLQSPQVESSSLTSDAQTQSLYQQTKLRLAIVWKKYQGLSRDRLSVLEQATTEWLEKRLEEEQRQRAQQAAHKLAGSLGIFGFTDGSNLAKRVEKMLQSDGTLSQGKARYLFSILSTLQKIVEQPVAEELPPPDNHRIKCHQGEHS
ncbi:MAG: response regulator [Leptolyngbyaceae cyanobacterium RU_5_1]|nr:response regulator [Leptolyngbyaceae cyanobacterium RU_5_1]